MDRETFTESAFDLGRLAYVAVVAALVVVLDVTLLGQFGIESTAEAILQFLTVTVGAYVGVTLVDVALDDAEGDERDEDSEG